MLAVFDDGTQLLSGSGGQDVDGVGYAGTREQFALQFLGGLAFQFGNFQATF